MFDYQEVKIVAVTQPIIKHETELEPGQWEGYGIKRKLTPDEFIAYCARVSNPANQNNTQTAQKLVNYLIKNEHWSPFEMVSVVMEIKTTRDIGRQILRHRSFSFQEFSQRYASVVDFAPPREARLQDKKNRQNSLETEDEKIKRRWETIQANQAQVIQGLYEEALASGIAKEQARAILPEGLTMSTMYMAGTLRSFYHYICVRNHPATQKEHRDIAEKITNAIKTQFPSLSDSIDRQIEKNYT